MVSILAEKQAHKTNPEQERKPYARAALCPLKVRQKLQCFGGSGQLHQEQEVPIKEEFLMYVSTLPFVEAAEGLSCLSFSTNLLFFQDLPSLCPAPGKVTASHSPV